MGKNLFILAAACLLAAALPLAAQDNYEIQVYGSETMAPGRTMVELHSNYTSTGPLDAEEDGVRSSVHTWHETIEITHGFTPWFETGFYVFTSLGGYGPQWVGSHIRPRVRAPESWHWPVGVSLSAEIGYQRREYSADTWTLELRPIVDKQWGRWYLALNPTLERALRGPGTSLGLVFSPNVKLGYDLTPRVNAGLEYYGSLGSIEGFDPVRLQQHQLGPAVDLNLGPDWEFNFGVLTGLTRSTDRLIVKLILGRRFGAGPRESPGPEGPH